jgi:hypothetical protein
MTVMGEAPSSVKAFIKSYLQTTHHQMTVLGDETAAARFAVAMKRSNVRAEVMRDRSRARL